MDLPILVTVPILNEKNKQENEGSGSAHRVQDSKGAKGVSDPSFECFRTMIDSFEFILA